MAQALRTLPLRGVLTGLGAVSPELAFAIRYAVCVSAAIWIGHAPGLVTNQSSWILITVLMVAQPESGGSLMKGLLRAVGTVAAAIIAIVLFGLFSQDPPLMLASLFLVQAVGAYWFSGPRYQYAWFVFALTTAIVLGAAMTETGAVETLAFQRATMVGLGLLIVFVVDMLLFWWRTQTFDSNFEVLKQMTSIAGEMLELSGPRNPYRAGPQGVIEDGAYADLLLVDGNPLDDISVIGGATEWFDADPKWKPIETIRLIMKDGVIYKNTL